MTTPITPDLRAALGVARAALTGPASPHGPADTIVMALDGACLLTSPAQADDLVAAGRREMAARVRGLLAEGATRDELWAALDELAAGPAVFYRAEVARLPLGTYATRTAARAHCTANLFAAAGPVGDVRWLPDGQEADDPTAPDELVVAAGASIWSGRYRVVPVAVAAAYDPREDG